MDRKTIFGFVGSVVLTLGVFCPIMSAPIIGSLNYFRNGEGDGVFVLILVIVSVVLTLTKRFHWLALTSLGSIAIFLFSLIQFQIKLSEMKGKVNTDLSSNPFRGFANVAVESVQLEWGWAILFLGAGTLLLAALLPDSISRLCPYCAESIKREAEICRFCKREVPDEEDLLPEEVVCPACGEELELDARERIEKKYECSACKKQINLVDVDTTLD